MGFNLKIGQYGLLVALLPVFVGLLILGFLALQFQESEKQVERERQAKTLIMESSSLLQSLDEMQRALAGLAESNAPLFSIELQKRKDAFSGSLKRIEAGLVSSPQKEAFVQLKDAALSALQEIEETQKALATAPKQVVEFRMRESDRQLQALRSSLSSKQEVFSNATSDIQQTSARQSANSRQFVWAIIIAGIVANVIVAVVLSLVFGRQITSRLKILTDNSFRLASRMPLHERMKGGDEISELDKSFHWMANELEDLTRKERAMTENAVDVICSITEEGNFREVNSAALKLWGYKPEELLGKKLISLVRETDKEKTNETFKTAKRDGTQLELENAVKHKNGNYVELLWSGGWSSVDGAMFCVAHDITEKKQIENLKRDFVNMVSHDLRTPLTSIQAFLEMLSSGFYDGTPEKMHSKAKYSEADVGRLISMINSLLQLEKMEAGHIEIVASHTQVEDVVDRSLNSVQSLAERSKVLLVKDICDAVIFADEDQLIQVLVNLLSNAIKFSNSGGTVTVRVLEVERAVEFQVIDQGRGIAADFIDKIFDRFKQVELSDSRVKGGTGLGLAVCKMLVEAHKGKIWVTSKENEGSTFHFTIPIDG
ncbi:MAG TPA: PAS domain S-box protein [Candidatus Melainabacteria bacterium]|nr:PAS domain S-box protein [Candidatus Melainabacteria bacterium]HIN66636.1 PAS domain S-box protein [Candidatus Obscuribacterales bacterium]